MTEKIKLETQGKNFIDGDVALDASTNTLKVYNSGSFVDLDLANLEDKSSLERKQEAQAYLNSLGILEDINDILAEKYAEYLI